MSFHTVRFWECRLYNHFATGSSRYLQTPPEQAAIDFNEAEILALHGTEQCGAFCAILMLVANKRKNWDIYVDCLSDASQSREA